MTRLTAKLREQMADAAKLDERIRKALGGVGHGWRMADCRGTSVARRSSG